jgi:hypothetical protein
VPIEIDNRTGGTFRGLGLTRLIGAPREIRAPVQSAFSSQSARRVAALDPAAQIRLFEKLKLARCARIERRPGFFVSTPKSACSFSCCLQEKQAGVHPCAETRKLETGCVGNRLRLLLKLHSS